MTKQITLIVIATIGIGALFLGTNVAPAFAQNVSPSQIPGCTKNPHGGGNPETGDPHQAVDTGIRMYLFIPYPLLPPLASTDAVFVIRKIAKEVKLRPRQYTKFSFIQEEADRSNPLAKQYLVKLIKKGRS